MMESSDNITEKNKCNSFVQNCTEINEEYKIEIKEESLYQELQCETQIPENNEDEKTKIKLEENDSYMQTGNFQEVTIKEEFNPGTNLQGDTYSQNNSQGNILQNLLTQTQPQDKLEVNNDQNNPNPNAMHYYIIFYPNPTPNVPPLIAPAVPPNVTQNIHQNPKNIHEDKDKHKKDMQQKIDFHQKPKNIYKQKKDVIRNPKELDKLERPEKIVDIDYTPKDADQTKLEKPTVFHQEFENFLKNPGYIHQEIERNKTVLLKPTEIDDPLSLTEIENKSIPKKSVDPKKNYVKRIVIRRQNIERGPLFHKKFRGDPLSLQENGADPLLLNQQIERDPLSIYPEIEPKMNIIEKPSAIPQEIERDPLSLEPVNVYPITQGDLTCDICNKSFPFPSSLATHRVKHTNDRPYKCSICGKSYKQAQSLDRHRLLHGDRQNYVKKESLRCHVCWRVFPSVPIINEHKCIQRFKCIGCDKVFNYKAKFDLHLCKTKHPGERPYKCEVCSKEFNKKMYLDAHKTTHETQLIIS